MPVAGSIPVKGGCDVVFQIGTAKYGVRDGQGRFSEEKLRELAAIKNIKMLEIKLSQSAKPGKGGIFPGAKVTKEISAIRGIPIGEDSISPNRHHDISNNGELLDKIDYVRNLTGKPEGLKTVLGETAWLDELFTLINSRGEQSAPDFITLDSSNGGTGAAPMTLIDDAGLNIHETQPILIDKLHEYDLKKRFLVIASGKLINPADVAWALCVGAETVPPLPEVLCFRRAVSRPGNVIKIPVLPGLLRIIQNYKEGWWRRIKH